VSVHYLHCSNGVDLIVDRTPYRARRIGDAYREALRRARRIMAAASWQRNWDDWSVHICDEAGEIARVPFCEAQV